MRCFCVSAEIFPGRARLCAVRGYVVDTCEARGGDPLPGGGKCHIPTVEFSDFPNLWVACLIDGVAIEVSLCEMLEWESSARNPPYRARTFNGCTSPVVNRTGPSPI